MCYMIYCVNVFVSFFCFSSEVCLVNAFNFCITRCCSGGYLRSIIAIQSVDGGYLTYTTTMQGCWGTYDNPLLYQVVGGGYQVF